MITTHAVDFKQKIIIDASNNITDEELQNINRGIIRGAHAQYVLEMKENNLKMLCEFLFFLFFC